MKNEIPRWGWYNGQILFQLEDQINSDPTQTISDFYNNFRKNNLNDIEFPLKNQGLAISLLYSLLVVPQQLWESRKISFEENKLKSYFKDIQKSNQNDDENYVDAFIRHMRNSISHANFEINVDGEFKFMDYNRKGQQTFEASIMKYELFEFIGDIGKYYINEVSNRITP